MAIYVIWASTGGWPVDRYERPVGVFTNEEAALAAAIDAENTLTHTADESVYVTMFELSALNELDPVAKERELD